MNTEIAMKLLAQNKMAIEMISQMVKQNDQLCKIIVDSRESLGNQSETICSLESNNLANSNSEVGTKFDLSEMTAEIEEIEEIEVIPKTKHKKVIKNINKRLARQLEIVEEYSPAEIKEMDNYDLASAFIRITGKEKLYCTHCSPREKSLEYWIHSIRKRCMKKGLYATMPLPKTCDKQQAVNSICNPVNNPVYSILRDPTSSDNTKQIALEYKEALFDDIGRQTKPSKY